MDSNWNPEHQAMMALMQQRQASRSEQVTINEVLIDSNNSQLNAFNRDAEIEQGASQADAGAGAFEGGDDDDNSVSSSKSYYKDLCVRLTFVLEKRKATDKERKNEIKLLKEEIAQLRR